MRSVDIHWIAGFIEGEGCFCNREKGRGGAQIVTVQKDVEPVLKLYDLVGGSLRRIVKKNGKMYWKHSLCGADAIGLMMTLYVLMSKRRQATIQHELARWNQIKHLKPIRRYKNAF